MYYPFTTNLFVSSKKDSDQQTESDNQQPQKKSRPKKEVRVDEHPQELGLGCVQISVTAATPMVEDADKSFLDDIKEDEEPEQISDEDRKSLEKDVADAVDEILEEARVETNKKVFKKSDSKDKPDNKPKQKPSVTIKETKKSSVDSPTSTAEVVKTKKEPMRTAPPSVPPPPPPIQQQQSASIDDNEFEANFDDAKFEANFDDAFGEEPQLPKQLCGGRASIPDELDPNQVQSTRIFYLILLYANFV